ncbi:MAG TPA: hypothetical protein VFJ16_31830 [Longimicrobium sp.]|nr:hypothetical protein [Longimicrobium sp.]
MPGAPFRDLATLLAHTHPHIAGFRETMDAFAEGLAEHPERAAELEPATAAEVIATLLSYACETQNSLNIELGRAGLVALPRAWLLARIEPALEPLLAANDEWEYRRMLEAADLLDAALTRKLVDRGLESANPDIREAAEDWRGWMDTVRTEDI